MSLAWKRSTFVHRHTDQWEAIRISGWLHVTDEELSMDHRVVLKWTHRPFTSLLNRIIFWWETNKEMWKYKDGWWGVRECSCLTSVNNRKTGRVIPENFLFIHSHVEHTTVNRNMVSLEWIIVSRVADKISFDWPLIIVLPRQNMNGVRHVMGASDELAAVSSGTKVMKDHWLWRWSKMLDVTADKFINPLDLNGKLMNAKRGPLVNVSLAMKLTVSGKPIFQRKLSMVS